MAAGGRRLPRHRSPPAASRWAPSTSSTATCTGSKASRSKAAAWCWCASAADGTRTELTPKPYSVRTRVHEYGGGAYVVHGSTVFFSNFADQRLYRQDARRRAAADHPRAGRAGRPALRRRVPDCRTADCSSACASATNPTVRTPPTSWSVLPADGSADARVIASGHDFYSVAAHQPRRPPPGLAGLGPPAHALGRLGAVGRPISSADGSLSDEQRVAGGPRRSRSSSRTGVRPASSTSCRTAAAGGTCTACAASAIEPLAPMAGRVWRSAVGLRHGHLRVPGRRSDRQHRHAGRHGSAGADLVWRQPLQTVDLPYTAYARRLRANGNTLLFIAASPTEAAAVVRLDLASGQREVLGRSLEHAPDAGVRRAAALHRVSDRRRLRDGLRAVLPAHQRRLRRAGRRAAAADRREPRRADGHDPGCAESRTSSTGPAAALAWSTSTTAAAAALGAPYRERLNGQLGHRRRRGLHQRGALPGRTGRSRRPAAGHPRRQRRRLHDAVRAGLSRRLRRRRVVLRRGRLRSAGHRHPQVRVALPGRADRTLPGSQRPVLRALADPLRRSAVVPGHPVPGPGRPRRPARASRSAWSKPCAPKTSRSPTWPSKANSTASAKPRPSSARSKPSSTSTRGFFGFLCLRKLRL